MWTSVIAAITVLWEFNTEFMMIDKSYDADLMVRILDLAIELDGARFWTMNNLEKAI